MRTGLMVRHFGPNRRHGKGFRVFAPNGLVVAGMTFAGLISALTAGVEPVAAAHRCAAPNTMQVVMQTASRRQPAQSVLQPSTTTDTYTVLPGDSLWKISLKYKVGWPDIYNANRSTIKNPGLIYPGQVLTIPLVSSTVLSYEQQVVALCNQYRKQSGLSPLAMNWQLERMARIKSQDMRDHAYFSHTSPTYGSPFAMMKSFGIPFSYAGENIAAGQPDPTSVVTSWMNSPGHRANILNANYTQIGVGFASGGNYGTYWTEEFIRP